MKLRLVVSKKEGVGGYISGNTNTQPVPQATPQPISQETLHAVFTEASERLSTIYKGGEFEYCQINHPDLYQAERDALNRVDALWFDTLAGKVSLEQFKVAVDRWCESVIALVRVKTNKT